MSWRHPIYRMRAGQVASFEEVNWTVKVFVEESVKTNEHNWAESMYASNRADLEEDVAYELFGKAYDYDEAGSASDTVKFTAVTASFTPSGNEFYVPPTGAWEVVETESTTASKEFYSPGGWVLVCATWNSAHDGATTLHALQVDGAVIPESIKGGVEFDNELNDTANSYGAKRTLHAAGTFALVYLAPGRHTVALVAACVQGTIFSGARQYVLSWDLNFIHMMR